MRIFYHKRLKKSSLFQLEFYLFSINKILLVTGLPCYVFCEIVCALLSITQFRFTECAKGAISVDEILILCFFSQLSL